MDQDLEKKLREFLDRQDMRASFWQGAHVAIGVFLFFFAAFFFVAGVIARLSH